MSTDGDFFPLTQPLICPEGIAHIDFIRHRAMDVSLAFYKIKVYESLESRRKFQFDLDVKMDFPYGSTPAEEEARLKERFEDHFWPLVQYYIMQRAMVSAGGVTMLRPPDAVRTQLQGPRPTPQPARPPVASRDSSVERMEVDEALRYPSPSAPSPITTHTHGANAKKSSLSPSLRRSKLAAIKNTARSSSLLQQKTGTNFNHDSSGVDPPYEAPQKSAYTTPVLSPARPSSPPSLFDRRRVDKGLFIRRRADDIDLCAWGQVFDVPLSANAVAGSSKKDSGLRK